VIQTGKVAIPIIKRVVFLSVEYRAGGESQRVELTPSERRCEIA